MENLSGKTINLDGPVSTCAVMDYLKEHNTPTCHVTLFYFYSQGREVGCIVCSDEPEQSTLLQLTLEETPLEKWHNVPVGMKRIAVTIGWIAYINGKFYYMTA